MDTLAIVLMAAIAIKGLLDYVADVVRRSTGNPDLNLSWFDFIALVAGLAIAWFAPLNAFADYITNPIVGVVMTGLLMGGGTALLNQVFAGIQNRKLDIILPSQSDAAIVEADAEAEAELVYTVADYQVRGW